MFPTRWLLSQSYHLVDVHTKIDKEHPKGHILHLYLDIFDGVGTMENVLVHLDVDKNIEPVVQALHAKFLTAHYSH